MLIIPVIYDRIITARCLGRVDLDSLFQEKPMMKYGIVTPEQV